MVGEVFGGWSLPTTIFRNHTSLLPYSLPTTWKDEVPLFPAESLKGFYWVPIPQASRA